MSFFGWSGVALTHGTMGGTDGQHWTENKELMKEITEKYNAQKAAENPRTEGDGS